MWVRDCRCGWTGVALAGSASVSVMWEQEQGFVGCGVYGTEVSADECRHRMGNATAW